MRKLTLITTTFSNVALACGLLVTAASAATPTAQSHQLISRASIRQSKTGPRIVRLLHAAGFVRSADSLAIRPRRAAFIWSIDVRTYSRAGGCHDLSWLRSYLAEGLAQTHAIHARDDTAWRWQGDGEVVTLGLNLEHCHWHDGRASGQLTARVAFVRFMPPP